MQPAMVLRHEFEAVLLVDLDMAMFMGNALDFTFGKPNPIPQVVRAGARAQDSATAGSLVRLPWCPRRTIIPLHGSVSAFRPIRIILANSPSRLAIRASGVD